MTKHKEAKISSSDNTPLLVGGVAVLALLAFSTKEKKWVKPIDYDQTYRDPKKEAFADVLRQFYRAFATPQGMTLAQFQAGRDAVLSRDYSWYKAPTTEASKEETEGIMVAIPISFSYVEAALAVEGTVNEAGFVRIVLNATTRIELAARASADGLNASSTPPTPSGGPTTAHKYAPK